MLCSCMHCTLCTKLLTLNKLVDGAVEQWRWNGGHCHFVSRQDTPSGGEIKTLSLNSEKISFRTINRIFLRCAHRFRICTTGNREVFVEILNVAIYIALFHLYNAKLCRCGHSLRTCNRYFRLHFQSLHSCLKFKSLIASSIEWNCSKLDPLETIKILS